MSDFSGSTIGPELQVDFWNAVFGRLPIFPTVSEPTATPTAVVAFGAILVFSVGMLLIGRLGEQKSEGKKETGGGYEEPTEIDANEEGKVGLFEEIAEKQQTAVAAKAFENDTRMPKVGDEQFVQGYYVPAENYPNVPVDGYLEKIIETTDVEYDLTIYFDKMNQDRAAARFKSKTATAVAETANSDVAGLQGKVGRQARFADIYRQIEEGQTAFKVSTYALVRAKTKQKLAESRSRIKETFADRPAEQQLRIAVGQQKEAIQSVSPFGKDVLGSTDPGRFKATCMAGAFGAAYASVTKPTKVEADGIEYGWHKSTQLPFVADPWGHESGNAMVMVAEPGGGKSTTGKGLMQRVCTQRDDVIGVAIEPMGDWAGVAEAFKIEGESGDFEGSEHITVGGSKGINPLEIREIPPEKRRELSNDADPLGDRKNVAMSFLENLFTMRGKGEKFADHRVVLENAMNDAYREAKIYHDDLDSHGRQSPTLRDIRHGPLKDRFENPEEYADQDFQADNIQRAAQWFYHEFGVFDVRETEGGKQAKGSYANFGKQTEFDIFGNKFVYLDLGQTEGNVSEKAQLTMQLLLDQVYEMSKQTDKKVVLAMDEFRYFIRDVANIDSIENLFRHHRHQDIAPWIMTQTVHEFLQRPESESILDMCPFFLGQKYEGLREEDAKKLNFSEDQYNFLTKKANPGTAERGYADALLVSGGVGRKLEVKLTDSELQTSEWDRDQPKSLLPGYQSAQQQTVATTAQTASRQQPESGEAMGEKSEATTNDSGFATEEPVESSSGPSWASKDTTGDNNKPVRDEIALEQEQEPATAVDPFDHSLDDVENGESEDMDTKDTDQSDVEQSRVDAETNEDVGHEDPVDEIEPEERSTVDKLINRVFDYFEDSDADKDEESDHESEIGTEDTIENVEDQTTEEGPRKFVPESLATGANVEGGVGDGSEPESEAETTKENDIARNIQSQLRNLTTKIRSLTDRSEANTDHSESDEQTDTETEVETPAVDQGEQAVDSDVDDSESEADDGIETEDQTVTDESTESVESPVDIGEADSSEDTDVDDTTHSAAGVVSEQSGVASVENDETEVSEQNEQGAEPVEPESDTEETETPIDTEQESVNESSSGDTQSTPTLVHPREVRSRSSKKSAEQTQDRQESATEGDEGPTTEEDTSSGPEQRKPRESPVVNESESATGVETTKETETESKNRSNTPTLTHPRDRHSNGSDGKQAKDESGSENKPSSDAVSDVEEKPQQDDSTERDDSEQSNIGCLTDSQSDTTASGDSGTPDDSNTSGEVGSDNKPESDDENDSSGGNLGFLTTESD